MTFTEFTCDDIDGSARLNIRIQKPADTNVGYVNQGVDILGYTYEIQNSNSESLLDSSGNFNVKTYDEDDFGGDDNFLDAGEYAMLINLENPDTNDTNISMKNIFYKFTGEMRAWEPEPEPEPEPNLNPNPNPSRTRTRT